LVSYFQSLYNDENTPNEHEYFDFIKKIAGTIHYTDERLKCDKSISTVNALELLAKLTNKK